MNVRTRFTTAIPVIILLLHACVFAQEVQPKPMDNHIVVKLVETKQLGVSFIVDLIQNARLVNFDVSSSAIVSLHEQGVDYAILDVMRMRMNKPSSEGGTATVGRKDTINASLANKTSPAIAEPNKASTKSLNGIKFEVSGCTFYSDTIACKFVLTNDSKSEDGARKRLRLILVGEKLPELRVNIGRPYTTSNGSVEGSDSNDFQLPSDTSLNGTVEFSGIVGDVKDVKSLTLHFAFYGPIAGGITWGGVPNVGWQVRSLEFRNIQLNK